MSIFIPGIKCVICGEKIKDINEAVLFPAFTSNNTDPLFIFNDAVIHKKCFEVHPMAHRMIELHNQMIDKLGTPKKHCDICGKIINDPDQYINLGCLSSDLNSEVSKYNFKQYHKQCFIGSRIQITLQELTGEIIQK